MSGSAGRRWILRGLLLVGMPMAFFAALEGALRLGGYGRSTRFLIPDGRPGLYRSNPEFVSSFLPSTFDLRPLNTWVVMPKPAGALRVVLLGESAAQGVPVPAFGFAAQLRAQLRARYPGREIEVINTGIVAINSHVIYQIARQLADFEPDVFVVYAGNNEVVGPYGPGSPYLSAMPPLWVIRLSVWVRQSRTGQLVNAMVARLARGRRKPMEWGGMSMFVHSTVAGDDPRLEAVYANFEANLRDIVKVASDAGARTLLCTVGCNLRDCAPFVSQHRPGLTADDLKAWDRAFARGRLEWLLGQRDAAERDLGEALRLDPEYAETSYLLGAMAAERGQADSARPLLVDAEHWDALRFRPDPRINAAVRRVASGSGGRAELLDTARLLGSDPGAVAPPSGRALFMEHVHLDWAGNFMVARAMAERVAALAGGAPAGRDFLDEGGCAAALGYAPPERLGVLQHLATITRNPPFTAQITYIEDEARLEAELAAAGRVAADQEARAREADLLARAMLGDPGNADLTKLAEDVADQRGDLTAALALARRTQQLQPYDFALATDEAIKLQRLGRADAAEALLRSTLEKCRPRDRILMAPAFTGLFIRGNRFDEGRRFLDGEIARAPQDGSLHLARARLERQGNDPAAAEADYRAALELDPANKTAQDDLVKLLADQGRRAEADRQVMAGVQQQPLNAENDLHAAVIADQQGDDAGEVACLKAAEHAGPVSAAVEMQLARKEFGLHHPDAGIEHLAWARRVAAFEGNPAAIAQINAAIAQVMADLRGS